MTVERRTLLKTTAAAAVGGPFAGLVAMPAGAHRHPDRRNLVPVADERDGKVRLHLPAGSATAPSTTPSAGRRSPTAPRCPAATTAWAPSTGRGAACCWCATTRSTTRARRSAPATPYDADGARRHHDDAGHADRRGHPRLHQPQRHDDELLRRPDAVGLLGHLRGDRQRPGRRGRLHRRLQRPAHQAARLRLRGAGQPPARARPVDAAADPQRRPVRPRGGVVRPARRPPLPHRGQLRASRRASTATARRGTR